MVAFNENLLDAYEVDNVKDVLTALDRRVRDSELSLGDPRDEWIHAVKEWLPKPKETPDESPAPA
jgi:F-type H+-transporting ATPase subunit alpha